MVSGKFWLLTVTEAVHATCWQAPDLKSGLYQWKVFVRDGRGYMNRTNQRPQVFTVR